MGDAGGQRAPVVTGLADIDPVTPLSVGMVLIAATVVGGFFTWGGLPWNMGPTSPGSTTLTVLLLIGSCVGWALIAYGVVIVAAKVDAIFDMLRGRDSSTD